MKKIIASEGNIFALKDKSEVYGNIICLGKYDSEENYIQITLEEAKALKEEFERKQEQELIELENKQEELIALEAKK